MCRYVYDGELEAQMYMLFDSNKQKLAGAQAGGEEGQPCQAAAGM